MSPIESVPFEQPEPISTVIQTVTANNMVVLYADKLKKRLCEWENVPETLREDVEILLAGGE